MERFLWICLAGAAGSGARYLIALWTAERLGSAAVTIGFLGGLTTYSSFNYETLRLIEEGAFGAAALNVTSTLVGGVAAGWLGLIVAREIVGR
jgi:CrcB protein